MFLIGYKFGKFWEDVQEIKHTTLDLLGSGIDRALLHTKFTEVWNEQCSVLKWCNRANSKVNDWLPVMFAGISGRQAESTSTCDRFLSVRKIRKHFAHVQCIYRHILVAWRTDVRFRSFSLMMRHRFVRPNAIYF